MKKVLHYIRKQPEETRRNILHLLTFILAFVLLALWVYSLGSNLGSEETQVKIKESAKPFEALTNNIPEVW